MNVESLRQESEPRAVATGWPASTLRSPPDFEFWTGISPRVTQSLPLPVLTGAAVFEFKNE